jgi:hypothetical protein
MIKLKRKILATEYKILKRKKIPWESTILSLMVYLEINRKYNNNYYYYYYYYYFVISMIKYEMEVALSYQMAVYTCYKPQE